MSEKGKSVIVALSGGVDSAAAAGLLLEEGYRCAGVYMITCDAGVGGQAEAEYVADKLGIELCVLDMRKEFCRILDYFADEYRAGRTPNPCVVCNRYIKFGRLVEYGREKGYDYYATGHYARVLETADGWGLYETPSRAKDQSYVLSMVRREVLGRVILPLGEHSKEQSREVARRFGVEVAAHKESQEICFVPDDDYVGAIEERCPELVREGEIVDSSGKVLGHHMGIHRYTIGQRRGLGVAMGVPYYVTAIDAVANRVTLGPKDEVMGRGLLADGVNWLFDAGEEFSCRVKIRYNDRGKAAVVRKRDDVVEVEFDEPASAITPGQLAVFYVDDEQGSRVAGSAWIKEVRH